MASRPKLVFVLTDFFFPFSVMMFCFMDLSVLICIRAREISALKKGLMC